MNLRRSWPHFGGAHPRPRFALLDPARVLKEKTQDGLPLSLLGDHADEVRDCAHRKDSMSVDAVWLDRHGW